MDGPRILATVGSMAVPGLGQLINGRPRAAFAFLAPSVLLGALALGLFEFVGPARLAAWAIAPDRLAVLLNLNLLIGAWRLVSAAHAFFDPRYPRLPGRVGVVGGLLVIALAVVPHAYVAQVGASTGAAMARIFSGGLVGATTDDLPRGDEAGEPGMGGPVPGPGERINILLIGIDRTSARSATLTDTMIVASLDPVGRTISMVSIPRDLVGVPLGGGNDFGPKLNSLYGYAERHRKDFPAGPERTLEDAIGTLLGIPIHYYARLDFNGFIDIIDAVGGVDVIVDHAFSDPTYDGYGLDGRGFAIEQGRQHLDGANALAYARVRKPAGETDFTRADRQQQILVALKERVASAGSIFWRLPQLIDSVGGTVVTDIPIDRLPDVALVLDEMGRGGITRAVITRPLIKPATTRYGASQLPDLAAIRAMAVELFSPPGREPVPWPTPKPTKRPAASASPAS
jgi:LCP family protein required for cell wall assembly